MFYHDLENMAVLGMLIQRVDKIFMKVEATSLQQKSMQVSLFIAEDKDVMRTITNTVARAFNLPTRKDKGAIIWFLSRGDLDKLLQREIREGIPGKKNLLIEIAEYDEA